MSVTILNFVSNVIKGKTMHKSLLRSSLAVLASVSLSFGAVASDSKMSIGSLKDSQKERLLPMAKASSIGKSEITSTPNDDWFGAQWYWYGTDQSYTNEFGGIETPIGGSNILRAFNDTYPNKNIRVGIVDFGFYDFENEIIYSDDGYSFAEGHMSSVGENFYEEDPMEEACIPHGASIAHIIGGETNNIIGGAGIANVDIVPVKIATCGGYGNMEQIVNGINYLTKRGLEGIPEISEPVDVINISLGINGACSIAEQEAIDYAVSVGIPVVVAAGNESVDVENLSPANCENVIVTGANNKEGLMTDFSNYGSGVDILAPGHDVAARGNYSELGSWDGTSQAAPIVTGAIAMLRGENYSLSPSEIESIIKSSATAMTGEECLGNECGSGRLDVFKMLEESRELAGGDVSFISDQGSSLSSCKQDLYLDVLGNLDFICEMSSISFQEDHVEGNTYELRKVAKGTQFNIENSDLVAEFELNTGTIKDLELKEYIYGYVVCDTGSCGDELLSLNMAKSISKACSQ